MRPTLAQRVCPTTVARASGEARARASSGVAADGRPQGPDVVAELADLGRRLVHEAQAAGRRAHRARRRTADRRPAPPAGRRPPGRQIQAMTGHQHVDSGRVPAPDLQAIERGQGHLDRPPPVQRPGRFRLGHEVGDAAGQAQPISLDGPPGVFERHQGDVDALQVGRQKVQRAAVELGFQAGQLGPIRPARTATCSTVSPLAEQAAQAGCSPSAGDRLPAERPGPTASPPGRGRSAAPGRVAARRTPGFGIRRRSVGLSVEERRRSRT